MKPIFPKGTKVVKGKVVQRKLPTSRMSELKAKQKEKIVVDARAETPLPDGPIEGPNGEQIQHRLWNKEFSEAVVRKLQEGRTGPRLAPGQQSKLKYAQILDNTKGKLLEDPRLEKELPKNKPGRIDQDYISDEDGYLEPSRMIDLEHRSQHPEVEGRGASPLSKIIEAMGGKKMPAPLLAQLKGLDPKKLEAILAVLNKSKTDVPTHGLGDRGTITIDPSGNLKNRNKKYDTDIPF
jgi:hypothetical protein